MDIHRKRVNKQVDAQIGARLRLYRISKGFSQMKVAETLGVTFQQVQKYEKGTNRISGSRMIVLCELLEVTPNQITGMEDGVFDPLPDLSVLAIKFAYRFDQLNQEQKQTVSKVITAFLGDKND